MSATEFEERVTESNKQFENLLRDVVDRVNGIGRSEGEQAASDTKRSAHLLLNCSVVKYLSEASLPHNYNSAVWCDERGQLGGMYHKMHPVMFGEYIPLADWFPILYRITPMSGGLTPGRQAESFEVAGYRVAPNICFESTVPHLVRRQVRELRARQAEPDLLVNVTNDGWFWGSSILDLHLRCAIFRAVEMRKPTLIAANTGISAWIDGNGVVHQRGPKRRTDLIRADVQADGRQSLYSGIGAGFGWLCGMMTVGLTLWETAKAIWVRQLQNRTKQKEKGKR